MLYDRFVLQRRVHYTEMNVDCKKPWITGWCYNRVSTGQEKKFLVQGNVSLSGRF